MNWRNLQLEIDWCLQNLLTLSAPVVKRRLHDPRHLQAGLTPEQLKRYQTLGADYPLDTWSTVCSRQEYLINLHILDLLDRYAIPATGRGLDIGAGNWAYLPALLSWSGQAWDGVELDAHRRDWTLVTRRAYAKDMQRLCDDCRYHSGSLRHHTGHYACITWFLPYVLPAPLHAARLPPRFFEPQALLQQAWSLLLPGGTLFIVNQGKDEATAQSRLFQEQHIPAQSMGEVKSVFCVYRQLRYGWRATKPPVP